MPSGKAKFDHVKNRADISNRPSKASSLSPKSRNKNIPSALVNHAGVIKSLEANSRNVSNKKIHQRKPNTISTHNYPEIGGGIIDGNSDSDGHFIPPADFHNPHRPGAFHMMNLGTRNRLSDSSGDDDLESAQESIPLEGYIIEQKAKAVAVKSENLLVDAKIEDSSSQARRNGTIRNIFVVALMTLAATVVLVPVLLVKKSSQNSAVGLAAPTFSPTQTILPLNPYAALEKFVNNITLLDDLLTPEGQAFHWIMQNDPSGLINQSGLAEWRFSQRYTLVLLYFSTNGFSWTEQFGFLSEKGECDWNVRVPFYETEVSLLLDPVNNTEILGGITGCSLDGQVESIRLFANNLTNTVPWMALSQLSSLRSLDLENNVGLVGSLPSELSEVANLQVLVLPACNFTGSLPTDWSKLTDLTFLFLSNNQITGTIPTYLGKLTNLQVLGLFRNNLRGNLPYQLGALNSTLRVLSLGGNDFTGTLPKDYAALTTLEVFGISSNGLSGRLPDSYQDWNKARIVQFDSNNLSGTLPESYASWTSLEVVSFGDNRFTGTLPQSYATWPKIRSVFFNENQLFGTLPDSYASWTNLDGFQCRGNQLSGTLPASYTSWSLVREVNFAFNLFSGPLPESYSSWKNVEGVDVAFNALSGTLPESFATWDRLRRFIVLSNFLSGTLPETYSSWTNANEILVESNQLSGSLPDSYGHWAAARRVFFAFNFFTGTIPQSYASWTNLEDVSFSANTLSGTLPTEFGAWTNLKEILAFENFFLNGTLPESYASWIELVSIDLSQNGFTGSLPSGYASWNKIWRVRVGRNFISGTLPEAYASLTNLQSFDCSVNLLTGSLPASYDSWTSIAEIRWNDNELSGSLPTAYASWSNIALLDWSNNRLSGTLPEVYSAWTNIELFSAYANALTGTIPPSYFGSWSSVREYDFTGNDGINGTDLLRLPFYDEDIPCNICGEGRVMTIPRALLDLSEFGFGPNPCRLVQEFVDTFPLEACPALVELATIPCGCEEAAA